jgi:hypothetical protein
MLQDDNVMRAGAVLTDEEIGTLLSREHASLEIKMLVLISRTVGGQRASDLSALPWEASTEGFTTCRLHRQKTRKKRGAQELEVPEAVRRFLAARREPQGRPRRGPCSPSAAACGRGEARRHELREALQPLRRVWRTHCQTRPSPHLADNTQPS